MSVFALRGTTARLALSVALAAGWSMPLLAQSVPPAPAPTFIPVPAPAIAAPETEWMPVTRMGFRFEIPASLPVDRDEDGNFIASTLDGDRPTGVSISIQRFDAAAFAARPGADSPALAEFLRQVAGLEMLPTGGTIRLGGFELAEYRGATLGADGVERQAVVYVSQELTEGEALMVVVVSAGVGGAAAGELEARFIGSILPEDSAPADQPPADQPPAGADADGAQDGTVPDATEPASDATTMAEAGAEGDSALTESSDNLAEAAPTGESTEAVEPAPAEADVADAGAEGAATAQADTSVAEAETATPEVTPTTEAPAVGAESAAAATAEASPRVLLPDLVSITLRDGTGVTDEIARTNTRVLSLTDGDDGVPQLRLGAGILTRSLEEVLPRMLTHLDALIDTEVGGLPAYVAYGPSLHDVNDATLDPASGGVPARVVIPRLCVDDQPPYVVLLVTRPDAEYRLDEAQDSLTLSAPAEASPCAETLADRIRAILPAPAPAPAAAADPAEQPDAAASPEPVVLTADPAAVPAGWVTRESLGLTFSLPGDPTRIAIEEGLAQVIISLETPSTAADTPALTEITLRLMGAPSLSAMAVQTPDQPGFAEMLAGFAGVPVVPTETRFDLAGVRFHLFEGEALRPVDGVDRRDRVLYVIAEEPYADGMTLWGAIETLGAETEAAMALERGFLASLGGQPRLNAEAADAPADPATTPTVTEPVEPDPDKPDALAAPDPAQPLSEPELPAAQNPSQNPSTAMTEARAWELARQADTAEAMLAYLAQFPRGLHSGEARGWLHARDLYAPDERRPEPAQVPQMPQTPDPRTLGDAEFWATTLAAGRAEDLWTYLKLFPQGLYATSARQLLAAMTTPAAPAAPMPGRPDPRPMK